MRSRTVLLVLTLFAAIVCLPLPAGSDSQTPPPGRTRLVGHAVADDRGEFPALGATLFSFRGIPVRVFTLLQHLSTAIGLAALFIWALRRRRESAAVAAAPWPAIPHASRLVSWALLFASTFALAVIAYAGNPEVELGRRLFHFAVGGMKGGALAWIAIALWVRFSGKRP